MEENKIVMNLYCITKKAEKKLHRTPNEIIFWKTINTWYMDF